MEVSIYEAKTHLSRLIAAVERGEEVLVSRHNKPVARIVSAGSTEANRIGALAGRPFRLTDTFDCSELNDSIADEFGISRE